MPNLWQRWFGGASEPPAHLADALDDLDRLARARPSLQGPCKVLDALIEELLGTPPTDTKQLTAPEIACAKLAIGIPLLRETALPVDDSAFRRRFLAVCNIMQQPDADILADALCKKALDPRALLDEVLAGRAEVVRGQSETLAVDPTTLATVLRLTALPALVPFSAQCAAMRCGLSWDYGYCPTCGGWPLLAEVRGLEQLRYSRCGLCGDAWETSRFRCPFCGNADHQSLGYFGVEGEEDRRRAATCDVCRGYVKVVSTLAALSPAQLLIADLATLHLDLVAAERGFMVPG